MSSGQTIRLGWRGKRARGEPLDVPVEDILRMGHVLGPTGCGKSVALLALLAEILALDDAPACTVGDMKGDLAERALSCLPSLALDPPLTPSDVCTVAPWHGIGIPLNVLAPVAGLAPEVQASLVVAMVGEFSDEVSVRMSSVLRAVCMAVMGVPGGGGSLLDVRDALRDEAFARLLALHVRDPDLRHFLTEVLWTSSLARTRESLLFRLDELLALPALRAMACGADAVDPSVLLTSRVTIINLGAQQVGLAKPAVFLGAWIFALIAAATFARDPTNPGRPCWVAIDEFQLIARVLAQEVSDLLSLSRSRATSFTFANQATAQLRAASPELLDAVQVNAGWRLLFQADRDALRDVLDAVPLAGRLVDPERPDRLADRAHERQALERVLGSMSRRTALLVRRGTTSGMHVDLVETPTLPLDRIKRAWDALPGPERERWRRGRYGMPITEMRPARLRLDGPVPAADTPATADAAPPPLPYRPRGRLRRLP